LIATLEDSYWQVRLKAVRSLAKLSVIEAADHIGPMMSLDIPNLRKECAAALGELAQPQSAPFLAPFVDDPDPDVRKNVRWAMSKIESSKE